MPTEPHATFNRRSGEILRIAVNVEIHLEHFLSNYFCGLNSSKKNYFEDEILQILTFQRKIELFEKLCKEEKFDKNNRKKILDDIKFIQKTRNKVAHYSSRYEYLKDQPKKGKFILQSRKSMRQQQDDLVLTQELVDEFNERYLSVYKGINCRCI